MMPERYYRAGPSVPSTGVTKGASLRETVSALGTIPSEKRRWRRTLRAGLFWTALGLGTATISYALSLEMAAESLGFDRRFAELFLALIPIPPLALGVHGLALALRLRAASALADRTAAYLCDHLPEGDRKSTRLNSSHRCISYA